MKCNFISFVIERSDPGIEPENSTSQPITINPTQVPVPVPANPLAELTETEPPKSDRKRQKTVENFADRSKDPHKSSNNQQLATVNQKKRKLTSTNAQTMVLVEKQARGKSTPAVTKYSIKKAM